MEMSSQLTFESHDVEARHQNQHRRRARCTTPSRADNCTLKHSQNNPRISESVEILATLQSSLLARVPASSLVHHHCGHRS